MATRPNASVTVEDQVTAGAADTGFLAVFSCVERNADVKPRVFGGTKGLLAQHGYSSGVGFAAHFFEDVQKPLVFVGVPTAVAGTIGRQNASGVLGTSVISVAAGPQGVLEETEIVFTVVTAGTIGVSGIAADLSCDGNRTKKRIRLGTASSYTIPYFGIVLNFAAGTLLVGDVYTCSTTAPKWDAAGIAAARVALATQMRAIRSMLVIADLENATEAGYVTTAVNAYETANKRFSYARANVRDRLPLASKSKTTKVMTGAPTLTFAEVGASGDTITRSAGSWISDGFAVGDVITVAGSASNNVTGPIASLSATVITLGTTDLTPEGPIGTCTVIGSEGLTFAEVGGTGDTITRTSGSWLADGFRVGDVVTITGTASNNVSGAIAALTATVLTMGTTDLNPEVLASHVVTITKGETMAAWVASMDQAFASVDAQKRIDLGLGRARKLCPLTSWLLRRPAQWPVTLREYAHDVQIPTYRYADGPLLDWSLEDADGNTVEYDERNDGGALAARFTCLTTLDNGPRGAFVSLSLTRADEGSLLSRTHNVAVANVGCTIVQAETTRAIGQVLVLGSDGKGTDASLSLIEQRVNTALEIGLLQAKREGQRASKAVWRASREDILNVPGASLTGNFALLLNGTLENIATTTRIQTAG